MPCGALWPAKAKGASPPGGGGEGEGLPEMEYIEGKYRPSLWREWLPPAAGRARLARACEA